MRLLIDINVVLDVILDRDPWVAEAAPLLSAIESGRAAGFVAVHSITTIHHLVSKSKGRSVAASAVTDLLRVVRVVAVGGADLQQALALGLPDFEDAVQVAAALQIDADYLVTRNERDFRGAPVAVRTPGEVLALLGTLGG